mgnify:CR=1 FL=1
MNRKLYKGSNISTYIQLDAEVLHPESMINCSGKNLKDIAKRGKIIKKKSREKKDDKKINLSLKIQEDREWIFFP